MTKTAKNSRYGETATAEVLRKLRASEAHALVDDGIDSEGYPLNQPREWSEDELTELRRRERACSNY